MERCSNTSGPRDSPEDLLVLLESLSHGGGSTTSESRDSIGIHRLYQPVQQVALMILPERFASEALISFSLQHLSWLHCGIRTMQFWREHQGFWDCVEHGDLGCLKRHDWMALYLSILVVHCSGDCLHYEPQARLTMYTDRVPLHGCRPTTATPAINPSPERERIHLASRSDMVRSSPR